MLIASSSRIVGLMNSQAIARSDNPVSRVRRPGPARATEILGIWQMLTLSFTTMIPEFVRRASAIGVGALRVEASVGSVDLAGFLEVLGPVLDQAVERLLRRALVGDDIVVDAFLHVE